MISSVGDALKTLDPVQFGKWNSYLLLKASFYESYVSDLHAPPLWWGLLEQDTRLIFRDCVAVGVLLLWSGAACPGEVWRVHKSPATQPGM